MSKMPYSKDERVFMVETYFAHKSYKRVRSEFQRKFPQSKVPNKSTILRLVHKFCATGSVDNRKSTGRPSLLTAQVLNEVSRHLTQSPTTSLRKLSSQTGLSTATIFKAKKKLSSLDPNNGCVLFETPYANSNKVGDGQQSANNPMILAEKLTTEIGSQFVQSEHHFGGEESINKDKLPTNSSKRKDVGSKVRVSKIKDPREAPAICQFEAQSDTDRQFWILLLEEFKKIPEGSQSDAKCEILQVVQKYKKHVFLNRSKN